MKVECSIFHGALSFPHDIVHLKDLLPFATKFYDYRPRMLKYYKNGITILIFTSFKFRIMGKGDFHKQVLNEFLQQLPWKSSIGEMKTNMTISHQLPMTYINLHKLDQKYFQREMELFPAAKLIHMGREHVNIFHTGNIIITGVCDLNNVQNLISQVVSSLHESIY